MINPYCITNFNRNISELQELLLFCIVVAGKTAHIQAKKLEEFLSESKLTVNIFDNITPFDLLAKLHERNELMEKIKKAKLGQYNKIYNAFVYLIQNKIDLNNCTTEELEKIPGVGLKTSRFFILHSRKVNNIAVLDVHILKFLGTLGFNVPKSTPNKKNYYFLEQKFLEYCQLHNLQPAEADLEIWKSYARKKQEVSNDG